MTIHTYPCTYAWAWAQIPGDDNDPLDYADNNGATHQYPVPPDGAFVRDSQGNPTTTFNPKSGLYIDWLTNNTGIRETVDGAFQTAYDVVINR